MTAAFAALLSFQAAAAEPRAEVTLLAQAAPTFPQAPSAPDDAPVYVPPKRGGPSNVAAAATRAAPARAQALKLLAPGHPGLTTAAQPTLYFYVGEPGAVRVRIGRGASLSDPPVATGRIEVASAPAIVPVSLATLKATLRAGRDYEVTVTMFDPATGAMRGSDSAVIQRIADTPEVLAARKQPPSSRVRVYAAAGLWFDALGAAGDSIAAAPNDARARNHRAALLEQAGLREIAEFDRKR